MDEQNLWLFIVHNEGKTWTRASIPAGIRNVRDLVSYLKRGGQVEPIKEDLMFIPNRARFIPHIIGETPTVLAQLVE